MQIKSTLTAWLAVALLGSLTLSGLVMAATNTYCFGRYLIDVSADAKLMSTGNNYISDREIKSEKLSESLFEEKITEHEKELKSQKSDYGYIYQNTMFKESNNKRILITKQNAFDRVGYGLDTYKRTTSGFVFSTADRGFGDGEFNKILNEFEIYLNNVRYRPRAEIPTTPGFCFENGFIPDQGETGEGESAMLFFTLKSHPDIAIQVRSVVMSKSTPSLLERSHSGLLSLLDGTRTLRKGGRVINGVVGEELLVRSPRQDGVAHKFRWETMGKPKSTLKPNLFVDLQTGYKPGGYTTSSVSDKEAIAIFDQIVQSIRLRPTN